jgi:hypothetical protein
VVAKFDQPELKCDGLVTAVMNIGQTLSLTGDKIAIGVEKQSVQRGTPFRRREHASP